MDSKLHLLPAGHPLPPGFTDPFCYEPHPLCRMAAGGVKAYVESRADLLADAGRGKMFGVLVVTDGDGRTGYLAAYSGLLAGGNGHDFFVPPVFDAMRPGGYFKTRESEIDGINRRIDSLAGSADYLAAVRERERCRSDNAAREAAFRQKMDEAKERRDAIRRSDSPITPDVEAAMIRESQFMKAELKRMRRQAGERLAAASATADAVEDEIKQLKARRRAMSDSLQQWLFSHYSMLNARGERRSLPSIFADTPRRVPPAGAGDCCAPKLLQYAYLNGMRPVCMAEFWWGESPAREVRHHLHYYPACRGKCLPILRHMLQGLDVEQGGAESAVCRPLEIVYEDRWITVVDKPAGMMSVPGRNGGESVTGLLRDRYRDSPQTMPAHRLDMDTSGLLVAARDAETYKALQAQFAARTVSKRYVALLEGIADRPPQGIISLPLMPDPLDRPYQKVDRGAGKTAVTRYRMVGTQDGMTRVELFPMTGRTHQLRLHCAHADGLGVPIKGDRLYGHGGGRLCLHAEAITFVHPATGRQMTFERKAEF